MMNTQLKYGFKKEFSQFFRKFKLLGIILAVFGFAIANPLMYKFSGVMFSEMSKMSSMPQTQSSATAVVQNIASDTQSEAGSDLFGGMGLGDVANMYNNSSAMFSLSLVSFASYSLLIIMLVMMSAAGGEQKKRSMIVPMCSGLRFKNYLLPKFIIYPLSVFILTFLGGMTAGGLCNAIFDYDKISVDMIALGAVMMAVYVMFIVTIYLSLGLCTSRPGIMAGTVFIGQLVLDSFLEAAQLTDYQPFTLVAASNTIFTAGEDFDLSAKMPSILTAIGLSIVICVLMYFLALGVLNAKKIDNTEEDKPAF